jgi:hypothetical protein
MSDIATAYKLGFCEQMAVMGILPSELNRAMEKAGSVMRALGTIGAGIGLGTQSAIPLLALSLGVPFAAGYGGGYLTGKANKLSESDLEALKQEQSLINYKRAIEQLKQIQATQAAKALPEGA